MEIEVNMNYELKNQLDEFDVIVIGAGMSGIACAEILSSKGVSCAILEARNRIGGRIHTLRFEDNLSNGPAKIISADVGASFIHGASLKNPLFQKFTKLGKKKGTFKTGNQEFIFYQDGKSLSKKLTKNNINLLNKSFDALMMMVHKLAYDICLSDHPLYAIRDEMSVLDGINYVRNNNETFDLAFKYKSEFPAADHFWNYLIWCYEEYEGLDFNMQGLITFQKEIEYPGGNCCVKDGYASMLEAMSTGLDIRFEQEVVEIRNYLTNNIQIRTATGSIYSCKRVIITVPLGVLKSNNIQFIPELPEKKQNAINSLKMGTMEKVVIQFEKSFWDKQASRIILISENKGEYPWIDVLDTANAIVMVWTACSYGKQYRKNSDQEIVEYILCLLRKIYGESVTSIISYYVTNWDEDRYSKGSWSVKGIGSTFQDHSDLSEPISNLFFSGEATSDQCPGTVTAAYMTGVAQAENIIKSLEAK